MQHQRTTKRLIAALAFAALTVFAPTATAQEQSAAQDTLPTVATTDSAMLSAARQDSIAEAIMAEMSDDEPGVYKLLKQKYIEGNAAFMSLVALALVLGLAFCIERIAFLTLSEVNAHKLMDDIGHQLEQGDLQAAQQLCRETRGPVAAVCLQGLAHADQPMDDVERSVANHGSLQAAALERGCSWIRLCIAVAPSLGFLGTVIGMVMAFDRIQTAGDISPTIVAEGMKVALITTIFGIVVALVLQVFYNYITTKIEHLTAQTEESAVLLLDLIARYKHQQP